MALRQEVIAGRGRGMVAARGLRAGEVLLRESPLLVYEEAEAAESGAFCSGCERVIAMRGGQGIVPCAVCEGATFCGNSCLESARRGSHSELVCKGIAALKKRKEFSSEQRTLAHFLVAAYDLAVRDSKAFERLLELEGQGFDEDENGVVTELHELVVEVLGCDSDAVSLEMSRKLLARDAGNAFGLMAPSEPGEERRVRAYAMYARASMFNHDCLPNACRFEYVDQDNGSGNTDVIVRALHDVEEGCEVCLSYFPIDWAFGDRQKRLQEGYGFWCKCGRCRVESEWKDEEEDNDDDDEEQEETNDVKVAASEEDGDEGEGEEDDDFGHAMFFVKYLCPVDECGGTMAPLPPGELDSQGLEGSMECNFCGRVRSDEEFHRDLEEHGVDDD